MLCQVVQHFTELGLNVRRARISSDGGWFVDGARSTLHVATVGFRFKLSIQTENCCAVFEVTDSDGSQVTSPRKLSSIKQVSHAQMALV